MMRWDSPTFEGKHGDWRWFVSRSQIRDILRLVVREHFGQRLWITTFDSGTITPNAEQVSAGWKVVDSAMVSPPLVEGLEIPYEQFDEWYIFNDDHARLHDFERFVNYGGFNLADPRAMAESFDPTWERSGLDWLYPIQRQFWQQINNLSPVSYIGSGDYDVVVTQSPSFAESVRQAIR